MKGVYMSSINWNKFQEKFGNSCHNEFESMARMIFKIKELNNPNITLNQLSNQAGIEVEPIEYGKDKISFQAKFFTNQVNYDDIVDSISKIIKYYENRLTKVILYCNKKINNSMKYEDAVLKLKSKGIELIPYCDENILDLLKTNEQYRAIRELYFGDIDYSSLIKERCDIFKNNIQRNYINSKFINRDELQALKDNLDKKYIVLHGDANTGKSAIIGDFCNYLENENIEYLPLNFDENYPEGTLSQYSKSLGFNISIDSLIAMKSTKNKMVLIIEQFDAIRWNSRHSGNALTIFYQLIQNLSGIENISIVLVTRTVDLEEVRNIFKKYDSKDENLKEIYVNKISDIKLKEILGNNFSKIQDHTKALLKTIGNIKIFNELSNKIDNICTQADLIKEFFNQKHQQLKLYNCEDEAKRIEEYVVQQQKSKNQLFVAENEIELKYSKETLNKMIEVGIFEKTNNYKIRFSHQCLYDYLLASGLYIKYKSGCKINNLIYLYNKSPIENLDVIKQFLEILKNEEDQFCHILDEILFNNHICFLFKKLALSEFTAFNYKSKQQVNLFYKIINSRFYGKKYIYQLSCNKPYIVETIIDNKLYDKDLSDYDFNQYVSILVTVLNNNEKFENEYLKLINKNQNNMERLSRLVHQIDDFESSQKLFDKKISIIRENPNLFEYHSIDELDSKSPERLLDYIEVVIDIDKPNHMIELIEANKIPITLKKYASVINNKIYNCFCNSKDTYGLQYFYDINCIHLYEKLDWLKDCFHYTLQFVDLETLKKYLNSKINYVIDCALNIIPTLKNGYKILNFIIDTKFITKQNFHLTRNRIHLISNCISTFNEKITSKRFKSLENEIINYRVPNWIEFAKERLKQRKIGIYCAFFGEEQKILLSSLNFEKLNIATKDFLLFLKRRFIKPEMYPLDYKEGVSECRTVVSCINDKKLSKQQWIKILTNNKTGKKERFSTTVDKNGNFVSSDIHSICSTLFTYANKNKEMFIDILQNYKLRQDFIPTILEALAINNKSENKSQNEQILNVFKTYFDLQDEYITNSFLRFIRETFIIDEWIIDKLIILAKIPASNRMTCVNEKNEYSKLWQEHFENNQTLSIYILMNYLLKLNKRPVWLKDLIEICNTNDNKMLKLSELELYYGCLNFDKLFAQTQIFNLLNQYPWLAEDNLFFNMSDYCIIEKSCKKSFVKFYQHHKNCFTSKILEKYLGRFIYYYVLYGYYKKEVITILKQQCDNEINIVMVLFDLIESCFIYNNECKNPLKLDQSRRLIIVLKCILNHCKRVSESLMLKAKENIYFFEKYNLLNKLLFLKNNDFMYMHSLLELLKILTPIKQYDSFIFKTFLYQAQNNTNFSYYSIDVLNCLYKLYGEYTTKEKRNKDKCVKIIEKIYKISYTSNLINC